MSGWKGQTVITVLDDEQIRCKDNIASVTWIPERLWRLGFLVNTFTAFWRITNHDESVADLTIIGEWSADGLVWERFTVFGPIPVADFFFSQDYDVGTNIAEYLRVGVELSSSTAYAKTATLSLDIGFEFGWDIGHDITAGRPEDDLPDAACADCSLVDARPLDKVDHLPAGARGDSIDNSREVATAPPPPGGATRPNIVALRGVKDQSSDLAHGRRHTALRRRFRGASGSSLVGPGPTTLPVAGAAFDGLDDGMAAHSHGERSRFPNRAEETETSPTIDGDVAFSRQSIEDSSRLLLSPPQAPRSFQRPEVDLHSHGDGSRAQIGNPGGRGHIEYPVAPSAFDTTFGEDYYGFREFVQEHAAHWSDDLDDRFDGEAILAKDEPYQPKRYYVPKCKPSISTGHPLLIWVAPLDFPRVASEPVGSELNPHSDPQVAVDAAGAGTTVILKAGVYSRNYSDASFHLPKSVENEYGRTRVVLYVRRSGTQSAPITIRAEQRGTAVLQFKFHEADLVTPHALAPLPLEFTQALSYPGHLRYIPTAISFAQGICHVVIEGLVMKGMSNGVFISKRCSGIQLRHLVIRELGASKYIHYGASTWLNIHAGIVTSTSATHVQIENCRLEHFGVFSQGAAFNGAPYWLFQGTGGPSSNPWNKKTKLPNPVFHHGFNHSHGMYLQGFGIAVRNCTFFDITQGMQIKIDGNAVLAGFPDAQQAPGADGQGKPSHILTSNCFGAMSNPKSFSPTIGLWKNATTQGPNPGQSLNSVTMLPPKNIVISFNTFLEGLGTMYGDAFSGGVFHAPIYAFQFYYPSLEYSLFLGATITNNYCGTKAVVALQLPPKTSQGIDKVWEAIMKVPNAIIAMASGHPGLLLTDSTFAAAKGIVAANPNEKSNLAPELNSMSVNGNQTAVGPVVLAKRCRAVAGFS